MNIFSLMLKFITVGILINRTQPFISFSLFAKAKTKSCFSEWFPENESVAIHFNVQNSSKIIQNQRYAQQNYLKDYSQVYHHLFDMDKKEIAKINSVEKQVFTYVTKKREILTICVDNYAPRSVIIAYNITMNIYNNDHSRVASKEHLKQYE